MQWFKRNYTLVNRKVLDLQPEIFIQDTVYNPDTSDKPIDQLRKYLIEGLENSGNIYVHVVDDDVEYYIDENEYDILEVLEGSNFDHVKCPEYDSSLPRETVAVIFFTNLF